MESVLMMSKQDLAEFMQSQITSKYDSIEVSANAACEILQVSKATLDRWVSLKAIKPSISQEDGKRKVRKFNLGMLLSLNKKELQKICKTLKN